MCLLLYNCSILLLIVVYAWPLRGTWLSFILLSSLLIILGNVWREFLWWSLRVITLLSKSIEETLLLVIIETAAALPFSWWGYMKSKAVGNAWDSLAGLLVWKEREFFCVLPLDGEMSCPAGSLASPGWRRKNSSSFWPLTSASGRREYHSLVCRSDWKQR